METKMYKFVENGTSFEMKMSDLVAHFGGYSYKDDKRITPKKVKFIVRVNRQGGEIIL